MKAKVAVVAGVVVSLVGIGVWCILLYLSAEHREWELLDRVPTSRIVDSKRFRVFAGEFEASPQVIDLGDTTYKIEEVWIECGTEPERISLFTVGQRFSPELCLMVRIAPVSTKVGLMQTRVRIKEAKGGEVYGNGYRRVLLSRVGLLEPSSFVLRCDTREREAIIRLKKKEPYQPPEPTSGLRSAAAHL